MPILIPVIGADEAPSVRTAYASRSSLDITSGDSGVAYESISAFVTSSYEGHGSIDLSKKTDRGARQSIIPVTTTKDKTQASVTIVAGDGFTILVDVLEAALSGSTLGSYGQLEINAELRVNGTVVPIKSFNFQVPTGRLGSLLNVVLADPSVSSVPAGASIRFSLIVHSGGTDHPFVLMDNGKLQARDNKVEWRGGTNDGPNDEVTFGAMDVIADKFSLAPRRPVVMFDPARVPYKDVELRSRDAVFDETTGKPILPILEPVYGLSMRSILNRAYSASGNVFGSAVPPGFGGPIFTYVGNGGTGCGFSVVITNIPDYKVRRADFTIEGGWHDGAQPTVAMYTPLYFVEGTKLFVIDVDRVLPYGAVPHQLSLADHKSLSEQIAFKPDTNAVLLTYQYSANDPYEDAQKLVREVFREDTEDNEQGRQITRRWDYEYYFADEPDHVLSTMPRSIEIDTIQNMTWYQNIAGVLTPTSFGPRMTHSESTVYTYENELLVLSRKNVQGLILQEGNIASLIDIELSETRISWTDDPNNPGQKIQDRVTTDVSGVVAPLEVTEMISIDGGSPVEYTRRVPVLLAQGSGLLASGPAIDATFYPVKSIHEVLHRLNGNQYNVSVVEIDHLNNTVKRSTAQPTTGSNTTDEYGQKSRSMLLRDLDSEAEIGPRIPLGVNAFELPRTRALELGKNALKRVKNPLMQMPVSLPGVDFAVARGTIVRGQKRNGSYTPNYFVTGYSINGASLGRSGHRISQTLEAIQLLEA